MLINKTIPRNMVKTLLNFHTLNRIWIVNHPVNVTTIPFIINTVKNSNQSLKKSIIFTSLIYMVLNQKWVAYARTYTTTCLSIHFKLVIVDAKLPQKKSLKKIEKQQRLRDKVKKESERVEKTIGSLEIPDMNSQELMDHLKKMKAITPTVLALQFNIKVSMAKRLLEQLRKDRILNMVSKSHNLKVYALNSD